MRRLAASMEEARHSAIDLGTARRELRALKELHKKFKQNYQDLIESLLRANNMAVLNDRLLRETKDKANSCSGKNNQLA